jgi:hypothetical protein
MTDTAATTLANFEDAFARLEQTVKRLDERQLTEIRDPAGWAAKDHLMHLALWEQSLLASVDGKPRHQALGIDASTDASEDYDGINAQIFAATRHRPLKDVLETLHATHAATRARLSVAAPAPALVKDVPGYTEHYDQHRGWIEALVGS